MVAVALNSGLVARPTGFTAAGAAAGLTLWLPDAPEGYAALGCIAAPGTAPPPTVAGACVHRGALVEAPLGEVLLLKQARPHACTGTLSLTLGPTVSRRALMAAVDCSGASASAPEPRGRRTGLPGGSFSQAPAQHLCAAWYPAAG